MGGRPVLMSVALVVGWGAAAAPSMASLLPPKSPAQPSISVPKPPPVPTPALPPIPAPKPPSVPLPKLPVPAPRAPQAPAPPTVVRVPSVPSAPRSSTGSSGSSGSTATGTGHSTSGGGATGSSSSGGSGASGSAGASGGEPGGSGSVGSGNGVAGVAPAALVQSQRIRQLVLDLAGCLVDLTPLQQKVLALRAAPGLAHPRSLPQVARRLDMGVRRVARIERRAIRRLRHLDRSSNCAALPSPFGASSGRSAAAATLAAFGVHAGATAGTGAAGAAAPAGGHPAHAAAGGGAKGARGAVKGATSEHKSSGGLPPLPLIADAPPGFIDWLLYVGLPLAGVAACGGLWWRKHRKGPGPGTTVSPGAS